MMASTGEPTRVPDLFHNIVPPRQPEQDPLHSRPFGLSFLVKDNSHSYIHLILALGIIY